MGKKIYDDDIYDGADNNDYAEQYRRQLERYNRLSEGGRKKVEYVYENDDYDDFDEDYEEYGEADEPEYEPPSQSRDRPSRDRPSKERPSRERPSKENITHRQLQRGRNKNGCRS